MAAWLMRALVVAAAAAVLILAGCGEADDSSSATGSGGSTASSGSEGGSGLGGEAASSSLSKDEFVKKASSICERTRENGFARVAAFKRKYDAEGLPEALALRKATNSTLIAIVEDELNALLALGAPSGEEAEVEAIWTAVEKGVSEAKKAPGKTSNEIADHLAAGDDQLRAYGLETCVKGS